MAGAPHWWLAVDLRLGQALRRPTSRFVRAGPEKGLFMCPFHIVPSLHEVYRTVFLCFILSFVLASSVQWERSLSLQRVTVIC